jgi:DNA binding domain, excisionase family
MKYYTVKEFAKKMKVSEGHIYELVKNGEIKKAPNTGRIIKIPSNQINTLKDRNVNNFFTYNPNKVEIIKTSLGEIRKLKNSDQFVLTDVSTAIGINQSQTIRDAVKDECIKKIELSEAQELGLRCSYAGLLIVSLEGLEEYSLKTFEPSKINTLLKELKSNSDYVQTEFKAVENSNGLSKMFEGHQVEIIEVDGDILFELYSTGMALGHAKNAKGKDYPRKDRIESVLERLDINPVVKDGQPYLTEQMLYDFMLETRSTQCIPFRKWVTNEVLPTIRKTGGYVGNSEKFVDNYFSNLSKETRQVIRNELRNKNKSLLVEIKPLKDELEANLRVIELITESFMED